MLLLSHGHDVALRTSTTLHYAHLLLLLLLSSLQSPLNFSLIGNLLLLFIASLNLFAEQETAIVLLQSTCRIRGGRIIIIATTRIVRKMLLLLAAKISTTTCCCCCTTTTKKGALTRLCCLYGLQLVQLLELLIETLLVQRLSVPHVSLGLLLRALLLLRRVQSRRQNTF